MQFIIKIQEELQLYEEDASLSLGWFEIIEKDFSILLFEKRHCMVFITLTSFIEAIEVLSGKAKGETRLVGEDNGKVFKLVKTGNDIELVGKRLSLKLNFSSFKSSILDTLSNFLIHCETVNKGIVQESAYIDLQSSYKQLLEKA